MDLLTTSNRFIFQLLVTATFMRILCQARSLVDESSRANSTNGLLWQPKRGTREEWMACHGMPKDVCERTKVKKQELQKILANKVDTDHIADDLFIKDSGVDQCIVFAEEQLDVMIAEAKKEEEEEEEEEKESKTSAHRKKRTLMDFRKYPFYKWSMPIPYMFDGTHDNMQKATIRRAFQLWMDNTCIRFRELLTNAGFNNKYILIARNESEGCWSYIGRTSRVPQPLNLASHCLDVFGVILHEIGHALGLYHEQSRIDRSNSVEILWDNIKTNSLSQYLQHNTDTLGLPYNYGSIMHSSSKNGFSVSFEVDTMIALDPLYQMNMGQRSDLSFHDRKIINLAYCKGTCSTPLTQPCQRGGYQNPNNCSTCICPDGFSGQYCDEIAQPKNANCGGILNIASGARQIIQSPGYHLAGYVVNQECTWWIKSPKDYTMRLSFTGSFSIYCRGSACFHWVEIKYKKDLGLEGARFCCSSRPNYTFVSEFNEMMVIFRSNYTAVPKWKALQRGFQAIVELIPPVSSRSSPTPTPASTSRTSTPVSTKSTSSLTLTSTNRTSTSFSQVSTVSSSTTTKSSTSTKFTPSTTTTTTTARATTLVLPVTSSSIPKSTLASTSLTSNPQSTKTTSSSTLTSSSSTSASTINASAVNFFTTTKSATYTTTNPSATTSVTATRAASFVPPVSSSSSPTSITALNNHTSTPESVVDTASPSLTRGTSTLASSGTVTAPISGILLLAALLQLIQLLLIELPLALRRM